jgi:hypothetical protein
MVVIFLAVVSSYAYYKTGSFILLALTIIAFIINKIARYRMDHDRNVQGKSSEKVDIVATDVNIITFLILLVLFVYGSYKALTFG